jgi:hypothetical protein
MLFNKLARGYFWGFLPTNLYAMLYRLTLSYARTFHDS